MGQKDIFKNLARFMNVYEVFTETGSRSCLGQQGVNSVHRIQSFHLH